MVLAQLFSNRLVRLPYFQVSIPQWFSLNEIRRISLSISFHVSIPHWFSLNQQSVFAPKLWKACFHPTLVLAQPGTYLHLGRAKIGFPSHIGSRSTCTAKVTAGILSVSIPHWFSLNIPKHLHFLFHALVSIPHWFSLNDLDKVEKVEE